MGRFNISALLNRMNTIPIAEKIMPKERQKTKRYNRVNPTKSIEGRKSIVGLR
jgi:hypothetical protein